MSLAPATLALLFAAPASADDVQPTRYELVQREWKGTATIDRGSARIVFERTVHNDGPKSDQATFWLSLPPGAAATRLRTASVDAKGTRTWFEGELMEAEAAAKKYRELTGIGGYYPKDPALLSWRHLGLLALQVFPVPARGDKTVEYTLELPLHYERGAYRVTLPAVDTAQGGLAPTIRFAPAHAEDKLTVNGVPASGPVVGSRELEIALEPSSEPRVTGAFASIAVAKDKHVVHASIAAAPRLSEAPRGAHVVVLFDASRSMRGTDAGIAAVRAYLSHMKDATVDFVTFDRKIHEPIGRRLPVKEAIASLQGYAPTLENGSAVDAALAHADRVLAASPAPVRRALLVTDTLTRQALTADQLAKAAWTSGAVLHIATAEGGGPSLERVDDTDWAKLPRRTGGLFWHARAQSAVDDAARDAFEEWARPRRIDRLIVRGVTIGLDVPEVLREGEGISNLAIAEAPTRGVALLGELWSRPVTYAFAPSADENKRWAALVFGDDLHTQLTEPEQMKVAMMGHVVSPVTSFLAIEPGVRPSTEGLDWTGGLGSGFGAGGGALGGIGLGTIGTLGRGGFDHEAFLRERLRLAAAQCLVTGVEVGLELESTFEEIVDLRVTGPGDTRARSCVEEAIWAVNLPAAFSSERADWRAKIKM